MPLAIAPNRVPGRKPTRHYLVSSIYSFALFLVTGTIFFAATILASFPLRILANLFIYVNLPSIHNALAFGAAKFFTLPATCLCFFIIYWILPLPPRPSWRRMLPAGIAMGCLWEIGKFIYVYSLPLFEFKRFYGPFYISISLIMWAFFSGFILLLGPHLVARNILPVIPKFKLTRVTEPTPPSKSESAIASD